MAKFKKKPVIIDAVQFTGDNWKEIIDFIKEPYQAFVEEQYLVLPTSEGNHRADKGDWIIRGVKGEYYPCKPDIFEQTYEVA